MALSNRRFNGKYIKTSKPVVEKKPVVEVEKEPVVEDLKPVVEKEVIKEAPPVVAETTVDAPKSKPAASKKT